MNILKFEIDTENGFAHIEVETDKETGSWAIQCCLKDLTSDEAENHEPFKPVIIAGNCGHNDGICGVVNAQAFKYWGENRCMTALFNAAKNEGVVVIGL